eukprot:8462999-Ditylum_brightwellii.AAC.1
MASLVGTSAMFLVASLLDRQHHVSCIAVDVEDHIRRAEADSCVGICGKVVDQVVHFFESGFRRGGLLGCYDIEDGEKREIDHSCIP